MPGKQFVFGAAVMGGWLAGCAPAPDPVGSLSVEPGNIELGFSEFSRVRLEWTPGIELESVDGSLRVFVHLLDGDGEVARTFDHPFPGDWLPGEPVRYDIDLYQSALGDPLDAGSYDLIAGLYDEAGQRWPLDTDDGERSRHEYTVAIVEIPVEQRLVPMLYFSEAWQGIEPGSDQQVLARRWLSKDGIIRVKEVPGVGRFRFVVEIPGPGEREGSLVLDEGWTEPAVEIDGDCTATPVTIAGYGRHVVMIELQVPKTECDVTFEPRFVRVIDDIDQERALVLENVAWSAEFD